MLARRSTATLFAGVTTGIHRTWASLARTQERSHARVLDGVEAGAAHVGRFACDTAGVDGERLELDAELGEIVGRARAAGGAERALDRARRPCPCWWRPVGGKRIPRGRRREGGDAATDSRPKARNPQLVLVTRRRHRRDPRRTVHAVAAPRTERICTAARSPVSMAPWTVPAWATWVASPAMYKVSSIGRARRSAARRRDRPRA